MSRYIDADKLEGELFRDGIAGIFLGYPRRRKYTIGEIRGMLKNERIAPTADVVEVVRCKECEYCHISTDTKTNISVQVCGYVGYNPVQSSQVTDNDYCSHGERREE